MKSIFQVAFFALLLSTFVSCSLLDPHKPPAIVFKTTTGYTSTDLTVTKQDTLLVGIIADKKEDPLRTYNISYAYDGAASTTTKETLSIPSADENHYDKDYKIITRNQAGTEKWSFTVTDKDGNHASLSFTLTVK